MKQTKFTLKLDELQKFKDGLGKQYVARVGVLGSGSSRNGGSITNAELAILHIFGSVTKNIPPRDFLMMPIETKKREIMQGMGRSMVKQYVEDEDFKKAIGCLGALAEVAIQEAFETGGFGQWPKLDNKTIAAKGSSAILIDTGELRKSISHDVVNKNKSQGAIGTFKL